MLERIVALFYVPWIFWSVPFLLAIGIELSRRWLVHRMPRGRDRR